MNKACDARLPCLVRALALSIIASLVLGPYTTAFNPAVARFTASGNCTLQTAFDLTNDKITICG